MKRTRLRRTGGLSRSAGLGRSTTLARTSGLKRTAAPKRRTPVRSVNPERAPRRRAAAFGKQAELCRTLPCLVCRRTPSVPAHNPSRGAGGLDKDTAPLCWFCHGEQHAMGIRRFQKKHGVDLEAEARRLAESLRR